MPHSRLLRFMVVSVLALMVMIVPWYFMSPYLAAPLIEAAGWLMKTFFWWVQGYERQETVGTLFTTLKILVNQDGRLVLGELTPEVNYRTFGYGVVLFWALLLASRPKGLMAKMTLGTLILVPSQVFSMCFRWLREALLSGGTDAISQSGLPRWMLEVVAYFDQLGFLIITPLMPILLWLVLDQSFIRQLWIEMLLTGAAETGKSEKPESST